MNTFQIRTMEYLSDPSGSGERKTALKDLVDIGFFAPTSEERSKSMLVEYVNENEKGFCSGGISRIRQALDLTESRVYTLTVDVTISGDDFDGWDPVTGEFERTVNSHLTGLIVNPAGNEDKRITRATVQRVFIP